MKIYALIISIFLSFSIAIKAQPNKNDPNTLMTQAQSSLNDGKYIEARYFYKKAYEGFAAEGKYSQAIECGLNAKSLFIREYLYKEAFDLYRSMDALIKSGEEKENKNFYDLRYVLTKERLDTYINTKNKERAKLQLSILEDISNQANNDSISEGVLLAKANYHFSFGPVEQGMGYYKTLIDKYDQKGNLQKAAECYKNMVALAEKVNNAPLAVNAYKQYIAWNDSVKAATAANELAEMKQKYDDSQKVIQEKESSLSVRLYTIIGLCVLSAILIGALIFLALVLLRYIRLTKKQKKNIELANEHNQLKSQFIRNISAQMDPALNSLEQATGEFTGDKTQLDQMQIQIEALRNFSNDIQELSSLENSLDELYELKDHYVNTFCEDVMRKIQPLIKPGVETQVHAFKLQAKINPEQLEHVLMHLLTNAALYTDTGKISLEFKKKGAHVHQFIVTDTGSGIPEELKENLFKPFTEIRDLTKGDGLGLPICSLITMKMNGKLTLDTTYTKGSRFILDLHT